MARITHHPKRRLRRDNAAVRNRRPLLLLTCGHKTALDPVDHNLRAHPASDQQAPAAASA